MNFFLINSGCFVAVFAIVLGSPAGLIEDEGVHDLEDCPFPANATFALCDTQINSDGKWFQTLTKDVTCPSTGVNTDQIMCIRAINLDGDSKGGYAKVLGGGGVGYYSATIRLTSQYGQGLNFHVQVYTNKNQGTTPAPPPQHYVI